MHVMRILGWLINGRGERFGIVKCNEILAVLLVVLAVRSKLLAILVVFSNLQTV